MIATIAGWSMWDYALLGFCTSLIVSVIITAASGGYGGRRR